MTIRTVAVSAFAGQRPGTSGLRQKVRVFRQPGYVEAFIQSLFEALPEAVGEGVAGKTLALGGDGCRHGRNFYARHDYEGLAAEPADRVIERLRRSLGDLPGRDVGGFRVVSADDFAYHDPVDGSLSRHQAILIGLAGGARIVYRLSGTGTNGATQPVYLEDYEPDAERHRQDAAARLAPLGRVAAALADIVAIAGRTDPSVIV